MNIEVLADSESVANSAAAIIADAAWQVIADRGAFVLAVSGCRMPWIMLRRLAAARIPWRAVYVPQVDERVAPAGHRDHNLTHLRESLAGSLAPPDQLYSMPVESPDLEAAADSYAATPRTIAGRFPLIDMVHLGMVNYLLAGDSGIPAGRIRSDRALLLADSAAAGQRSSRTGGVTCA